eukprot:GHVQ01003141.1.p1 GENE.GHVQ01003141.1~~GHVQ01003141.1.p1  ORF type:complete len:301 (+),score=42.67 GHVQ01003141.1:104-1006(+)
MLAFVGHCLVSCLCLWHTILSKLLCNILYAIFMLSVTLWGLCVDVCVLFSVQWCRIMCCTDRYVVVSLQYSPFCEAVHWALDTANVAWKEWSCGLLCFGQLVRLMSGGVRRTVPFTVLPNGSWIGESADVIRHLARTDRGEHLLPNELSVELFNDLADEWTFGKPALHIPYGYLLSDPKGLTLMYNIWLDRRFVPVYQRVILWLMWPYVTHVMQCKARWGEEDVLARNIELVDDVWRRVDRLLEEQEEAVNAETTAEVGSDNTESLSGEDEGVQIAQRRDVFITGTSEPTAAGREPSYLC